jgi:DNA ligase (NAD+)
LTKKDLERLDLFKDKKIEKLLLAIKRSKSCPLFRFIYALGIRHIGEKAAFVLANKFKSLDNLLSAKIKDLENIYEIGPVIAKSVIDYFSQNQIKKMIKDLKDAGLSFHEGPVVIGKTPLTGKSVVFTGELKNYSRLQAEELVRNLGGIPSASVSKSTDFLIIGENPGSKLEKAKKSGVKIIDEKKFQEMIK